MKKIYYYLIATVLFLSGITFAGTIKGKVTNGTAGFKIPKNIEVELSRFVDQKQDEDFKLKTTVDKNGFFTFKDLAVNVDSGSFYQPSILYKAVGYTGKKATLSAENPSAVSDIIIYEPTNSDSLISTAIQHYLIIPTTGFLEIQEILLLENKGDRTYRGTIPTESGKFITVNYKLPKAAGNISIGYGLMSCCVEPADGGFYDTMEILPGEKQISFTYKIKAPNKTIKFSREFSLPTGEFDVFFYGKNAKLSGDKLKELPDQIVENKVVKTFQAVNLKAGDKVIMNIAGLTGEPTNWSAITLAGVAGVLLLVGIFVFLKQKKGKVTNKEYAVKETLDTDDRDVILQRIIQLDEKYETGKLNKTEYLLQRNKLKDKLK
ncbi:MAG TPA: hypothetical protein ENI57_06445 [Ignavibacteria bacterium]|nr:hypothetical protein [Ignavibacteria bacterium]